MKALTVAQVLRLQARLLDRFGGAAGVRDLGALEGALGRPFAEFEGVAAFPEVHDKAAALFHGLVTCHTFVDGNERVGLAVTLVWLEVNGYRLALGAEQRYDTTMRVADGTLSTEALAALLRQAID
ncbi:MAG: type II toxin-antitoxin system death-on-curing family toxin [Trueperaceae bacterium]